MGSLKEIDITEIEGIRIGNAQNYTAGTGVTVILAPKGMAAGVDIRGGGPASRETPLLDPVADAQAIHAVVLSGGSAFGLECSCGVMEYLEKKGIGFDTGFAKVPLVCQSCIFDLGAGSSTVRPDKAMGIEACKDAYENNKPKSGCIGAGTGATVGKILGAERCMKSGLGIYAVQLGELKVGAVVALNAFGDIFDTQGRKIAGLLNEDGTGFASTEEEMYKSIRPKQQFNTNTTIGAVITNGKFDKTRLKKIAAMTHNGYARSINPVHTMADGDSIYALSTGNIEADLNTVGTLSARVMSLAIEKAVKSARPMYGLKSFADVNIQNTSLL